MPVVASKRYAALLFSHPRYRCNRTVTSHRIPLALRVRFSVLYSHGCFSIRSHAPAKDARSSRLSLVELPSRDRKCSPTSSDT